MVADGLGGHEAGDHASGMVIQLIGSSMMPLLGSALAGQSQGAAPPAMTAAIDSAIKTANRAVIHKGNNDVDLRGMGATAAVLLAWDGQVQIGHVGDCRVYRYRAGSITQITRDQTLVAKMVDLGHLRPEEAATHPMRNEVTQAVGKHPNIEPGSYQLQLAPGDWVIVACDGLHAHVEPRAMETAIRQIAPSAHLLANHLVELANRGGGTDNTTVVAIRCY